MKKRVTLLALLVFSATLVLPLRAQEPNDLGGCVDSPENPTLVLAGLAAGAFAFSSIKARVRTRRRSAKPSE